MRPLAFALTATLAAGPLAAGPLAAGPVASARTVSAATEPTDVCVIDDTRATEISGIVATATGYVAVNDSQFDPELMQIIYLDADCKVTSTVPYPTTPRDPEDLAIAPDGNLWVADTGDNVTAETRRETVALWLIPSTGGTPVIHRLAYPDGPHDAEALLFAGDGTPIIITKETNGVAGLYQPTGPMQSRTTSGVPLARVGEFKPVSSGENNQLGVLGELLITGAATAPDRSRVALRTYTGAYEWDIADGDVVKAITTGTPRLTGLPDESQGEALAYTIDGTAFLTVSDELGPTTMRRHDRSAAYLNTPPPSGTPTVAASPSAGLAGTSLWLTVAAGGLGMILAIVGFLGLRRARSSDAAPAP